MATVKALGLAVLLLTITLTLSHGQERVQAPSEDIVVVKTISGTI